MLLVNFTLIKYFGAILFSKSGINLNNTELNKKVRCIVGYILLIIEAKNADEPFGSTRLFNEE
jgi:hypothetical protein